MMEDFLIFSLQALFVGIGIALVLAIVWMMYQIVKFMLIVMKIHSSASKKPHGHIFALANFFDERILDEDEKRLRGEGFEILNKVFITAFISSIVLISMVMLTS